MSDAYSSFDSLLEEYAVTTLAADANLADGSGTRIECNTFEAGLRADLREYMSSELPAIVVESEATDDEAVAIQTEGEASDLFAYIIVEHGDFKTRRTLCKDIGHRVKRVFREQVEGGAFSNVDAQVPGGQVGSIMTMVSGPIVEDAGQTDDRSRSPRAVGLVRARVTIDVDASI